MARKNQRPQQASQNRDDERMRRRRRIDQRVKHRTVKVHPYRKAEIA